MLQRFAVGKQHECWEAQGLSADQYHEQVSRGLLG